MDKVKIVDALRKLEVKNDQHWTKDGAPMLSILSIFAGSNVSREDADAAAPGFARDKAESYFSAPAKERPKEDPAPVKAAEPAKETTNVATRELQDAPVLGGAIPDLSQFSEEEVLKAIERGQEYISNLLQERDRLNQHLAQAQAELDKLITANAKPAAESTATADYLRAQERAREDRAARIRELNAAGMTPTFMKTIRDSVSGAPVDVAAKTRRPQ